MNTRNLLCPQCCTQLEIVYENLEDDGPYHVFRCPFCGMEIECKEPPKEEIQDYDFYKDGQPIIGRHKGPDKCNDYCLNCGHEVYVGSNLMLSDISDDIEDENDNKLGISIDPCHYCGYMETRWDTSVNDRKKYKYWK